MKLPYYIVFQILSLFLALKYIKHLRQFGLQSMLPLLILVCGIEIFAVNYQLFGFKKNLHIYNAYILISPIFYYHLFLRITNFKSYSRVIYISVSIAAFLFFIVDHFFIGSGELNHYSLNISMIAYLILSCIVLSQMVKDDTRQVQLISEPYFWIAAGIVIFSLVSVVVLSLHSFIARNKIQIAGKNAQQVIMPIVNVVMYSCFAYSFYLCKRILKPTSH